MRGGAARQRHIVPARAHRRLERCAHRPEERWLAISSQRQVRGRMESIGRRSPIDDGRERVGFRSARRSGKAVRHRYSSQRRRAAEKKRFKRSRGEEKNARKDAARAERCPISRGDTVFRRDRDDRRSLDLSLCRRTRHGRLSIKRESSVEKKTSPTDLISGRI